METYIQPTASGRIESGTYGCVRDNGQHFHEGIDIKSIERTRRNVPQDKVRACLPGKVVYCNPQPKQSSYGRYIILEHTEAGMAFYTLYAHLASILPTIKAGISVKQGTLLGIMGHSSNQSIPLERAHLHFEIGLRLGSKATFELWYHRNFKGHNMHGEWNGLNLTGLDPLQFFRAKASFPDFLQQQPVAFTLKIPSGKTPDFVKYNPGCVAHSRPIGRIYGWEVDFNWVGAPLHWRPVAQPLPLHQVTVIKYDLYELQRCGNRHTLEFDAWGQPFLGKTLQRQLFVLFGKTFVLNRSIKPK